MKAIQNEIDAFQVNCDDIITADMNDPTRNCKYLNFRSFTANTLDKEDCVLDNLRGDQFLKSSMKMQSEFIGRALLEVWRYHNY